MHVRVCSVLCVHVFFLQDLLSDRSRVLQVVLEEARAVAAKHGQPRRSRILVRAGAGRTHSSCLLQRRCTVFGWLAACGAAAAQPEPTAAELCTNCRDTVATRLLQPPVRPSIFSLLTRLCADAANTPSTSPFLTLFLTPSTSTPSMHPLLQLQPLAPKIIKLATY